MAGVLIEGDGVAARCCALLLRRAGFAVRGAPADRARLPAIMLSDAAVGLMRDVFGRDDLFRDCARIAKRMVAWGPGVSAVALDHAAVVVSEEQLLAGLGWDTSTEFDCEYRVIAAGSLPFKVFGSRFAAATPVVLKDSAEPSACWIESLEEGWLFLIANAPGRGWLLSVGSPAGSRLVMEQIEEFGPPAGRFPAAPRIASPLCGPNWVACGSAAMGFDPICGDGTAHAVREAILCSAVLQALAGGGDALPLMAHYEARLKAGFRRHLEMCLGFYQSGGTSDWWRSEADALRRGLAEFESKPAFRYRLNGFQLEAV